MKKFLVYLITITMALVLGGILGNLLGKIDCLWWLAYQPAFHLETANRNWFIADVTFGFENKCSVCQMFFLVISFFVAPKILPLLEKKG